MNPYEVLGIGRSASIGEIEEAYRSLVKKYHPDVNQEDPDAAKKFKDVQKAYEQLKRVKTSTVEGFEFRSRRGFNDFDIHVDNFFAKSVFKGRNLQSRLELTLAEVLTGCTKDVKLSRRNVCGDCSGHGFSDFISCENCNGEGSVPLSQPPFTFNQACSFCGGTGRVNVKKCVTCSGKGYSAYEEKSVKVEVPMGVEHGAQITLRGEGEPSLKGGKSGDLIVVVSVKPDPVFRREGCHLAIEVPVSYTQLVFGCELTVPSIAGESLLLKVPSATQVSNRFRIKGKGLPQRGKELLGDMLVSLKLEVPKDLSKDYEESLRSLSFLEEKYITLGRKSWREKFS